MAAESLYLCKYNISMYSPPTFSDYSIGRAIRQETRKEQLLAGAATPSIVDHLDDPIHVRIIWFVELDVDDD